MKKITVAILRFVYCTWHGALIVSLAAAVVLLGLQFANCCLGDLVPWPKEVHLAIVFATVANFGVAIIVSLCSRKWWRAIGQSMLCFAAFIGVAFLGFISYCTPTRMTSPPSRGWTSANICLPAAIAYERLAFIGGLSQRENIAVFVVTRDSIDKSRFSAGSPWTGQSGDKAIAHYRNIMKACRIDVSLTDDTKFFWRSGNGMSVITIIEANGKTYLVHEQL